MADEKNPIEELKGLIGAMATDRAKLSQRVEEMQASIAAYQEAAKKGFVIPNPSVATPSQDDYFKNWNLAMQGRALTDKIGRHGKYVMPEEKRELLAKYYLLALKAAGGDWTARQKFGEIFKTPIGDSGNAFPLPDILESEILAFEREASVALQFGRVWNMTGEKLSIPAETTAVTTAWLNTTTNETTEHEPVAVEVELSAYELGAYSVVRNMVLQDTVSDIVSWLTEALAEAAGQTIDTAVFKGDGTSNYGSCSGLLSAAVGYSVVMASGSTAFSNLNADHLSDMIAKLDGKRKNGARYFMHGEIINLVRKLKDDNGLPIFYAGSIGSAVPPLIHGYPYSEVIAMPSTSAANTAFIVFGNLRNFAIGQRINSTALEVDPYGLFHTNRTRFKLYQRWGLKMGLSNGFVRMMTHS